MIQLRSTISFLLISYILFGCSLLTSSVEEHENIEVAKTPEAIAFPSFTPTSKPIEVDNPTLTQQPNECVLSPGNLPLFRFSEDPLQFSDQIICYLDVFHSVDGLERSLTALDGTVNESEAEVTAQVRSAELTGDNSKEVIVYLKIVHLGLFSREAMLIFSPENASFRKVFELGLRGQSTLDADGIRSIVDMTSNGIPDIVISYIDNLGGSGGASRSFKVVGWNGEEFIDFTNETRISIGVESRSDQAESIIADDDNDGVLELHVTNEAFGLECEGPSRSFSEVWSWGGTGFVMDRLIYEEPAYRFQAVHDGDYESSIGNFGRAFDFYRRAILDESLQRGSRGDWIAQLPEYCGGRLGEIDLDEPSRLKAYAHYRILLIKVVQSDLQGAEDVFQKMIDTYQYDGPGGQYLQLAQSFWNKYIETRDIEEACDAAIVFSILNDDEVLLPLGGHVYGAAVRDYEPSDICPFPLNRQN